VAGYPVARVLVLNLTRALPPLSSMNSTPLLDLTRLPIGRALFVTKV